MRAYLPAYELAVPRRLDDALALVAQGDGEWRPFAGGTDLMVLLEAGRLAHKKFFSITQFKELRGIEETTERVSVGALATYTDVRRNELLTREFPLLGRAAAETGGLAIQNRGTIGGNIANASPAADTPPALLVYDAELELVSAAGTRRVPYADFHTGYKQTVMRADELIARIHLPRTQPHARQHYRKVGTRRAQAISKVCFAAYAETEGARVHELRLAFGSVAPVVLRCRKTEAVLAGRALDDDAIREAAAVLAAEIVPIDDVRSTKNYRLRVAVNLLTDFLSQLKG